jgi:hypothetical protein
MKPSMTMSFRLALASLACAGMALVAFAQNDATAPPGGDSAPAPAGPAPGGPRDSGAAGPGTGVGSAAQPSGQSPPPPADEDEFVPSEEIPADEEVTFPVNI